MKIEVLDEAEADLVDGFHFYEGQETGIGWYFLDSLFSDIDSLLLHAGIHQVVYGYRDASPSGFPLLSIIPSKEKPFGCMQSMDCRRNPSWIRSRVKESGE